MSQGITLTTVALTVATAGTATQCVSSTGVLPSTVYFEAPAGNTAYIYIGTSTVGTAAYMAAITAGQGFTLSVDMKGAARMGSINDIQLSSVYINGTHSGDTCMMTYFHRHGG